MFSISSGVKGIFEKQAPFSSVDERLFTVEIKFAFLNLLRSVDGA